MKRLVMAALVLAAQQANAGWIDVEPDAFAEGTELSTAVDGVTLSNSDRVVIATNGYSPFNDRNIASTGSMVFGHSGSDAFGGKVWNEPTFGMFRADFDALADRVQLDISFDDDDDGSLYAFGVDGLLLDSQTLWGDGRGSVPMAHLSVGQAGLYNIAYILAGGVDGGYVDNLRFHVKDVPEPGTLALMAFGLMGFWARRLLRT